MRAADVYERWAPPEEPWSAWAKPVAFTTLDTGPPARDTDAPAETHWPDVSWAPDAAQRAAVIVDLPGVEALHTGVALARRGYRPVPLFNACHASSASLDMTSIVRGFLLRLDDLVEAAVPPGAPPAFLLDARRERHPPPAGMFDNRWVVLPQDFPSATLLASRGIRETLLVQRGRSEPREDLSHALLRWQQAGVVVRSVDVARADAEPIDVPRPRRFRSTLHILMALLNLRRSSAGGFGALVPIPPPPGSGGFA